MTATLLAFHNDPKVRAKYTRRVRLHAAHDEIVKGQYWENGKGCAVGCILHSSDHAAAESELGLPAWLMHLVDDIFEALSNADAKVFPAQFLRAIPTGADLAPVRDQFLAWLMDDAARDAWDARAAFVLASRDELLRLLAATKRAAP